MGSSYTVLHKSDKVKTTGQTTIKCSRCFRSQVKRACHHCGAYLCEDCEPQPVRWLRQSGLYPYLFKDHEFSELLEFPPEFQLSAHCREHVHYAETLYFFFSRLVMLAAAAGALVAWLLGYRQGALGLAGLAIGSLAVLLPARRLLYGSLRTNPLRPYVLLPAIYQVEMAETVTADFRIDEPMAQYLAVRPAKTDLSGRLTVSLASLPGHRRRHKQAIAASRREAVGFAAGYLGLDNLEHVAFDRQAALIKYKDQTVSRKMAGVNHRGQWPLMGRLPVDIFQQLHRDQAAIILEQAYRIEDKAGWVGPKYDREFPFWIMAQLSLARRELAISFYVTPEIPKAFKLDELNFDLTDEIAEIGVEIGGLLYTTPGKINWVNPRLQPGINRFPVKFRKQLPRGVEISGDYKLTIEDFLLSGLKVEKEGQLWFANGEPVPAPGSKGQPEDWLEKLSKKTTISGTFSFDTSVFKVQQEHTASDQGEERHCRPDHNLVANIAQILTDQNVEIKSIVETPPRIGDFRDGARLWDHYWEIKSRYYLEAQLQFIEVHVVIYGQENWSLLFKPAPPPAANGSQPVPARPPAVEKEEYKHEYVRWQLHLRCEVPVHDRDLAERVDLLCEMLGGRIRTVVAGTATRFE